MKNHRYPAHEDLDAVLGRVAPDEAARLRAVWHAVGSEEPIDFPDPATIERARERLRTATAGKERQGERLARPAARADRRARPRSRAFGARRMAIAAMAALLLGALGVFLWLRPVVQRAAPGERLAVTMPDGSRVELNSGATLRYRRHFGDVRAVDLEGEAFFEVAPETRPFVVHTFNAQVRVTGTRFNVRAWPRSEEHSTTVALESGGVTLAPSTHPERAIALMPGQTRRIMTDADGVGTVDSVAASVNEATAWRRGDLIFIDQHLGVILDDVERRFALVLQAQPATLRGKRLSLALRQPADAEAVVRDVAEGLHLRYRATSNGFELYE